MATRKPKKSSAVIDEPEEAVEVGVEAVDDSDDEESSDYSASSEFDSDTDSDDDGPSAAAASDDHLVDYSVKSREMARQTLNDQIAEFLARGGQINHIDNNVTADPPRKPTSNYGSRPI
ncbi:hypothetical protein QWY82_03480 [Simiduia curdlanivorans]|uniref:Transcriptional regulator SutA RNAP-binding domain-containing protein n=1 Tax=Simiduia curdlanivorans TaxID=1492769 RepID=A0ABV8V0D8_9GAMM|nr:hypothetical protein [Simiduia curdlanivorans]MDN3637863.1 hypothetical protein [Simiduia curdlanivorans]